MTSLGPPVPPVPPVSEPGLPRAVVLGLVLFAVGLLFIAADVLPLFAHQHNRPLWLNLACLTAPLGFAIAVGSAVRGGRARQRRVLDEVSGS